MLFTNGETVFLTLGIPVVFLLFFSAVHVLPTGTTAPGRLPGPGHPGPGRHVDVDDRPVHRHRVRARLRRAQAPRFHPARPAPAAGGQDRGRHRRRDPPGRRAGGRRLRAGLESRVDPAGPGRWWARRWLAMVLGTVAFGGIGLVLAGTLKPLVNLAVVNALFVVLLLLGGMLIPLSKLPTWLADLSRLLPAAALAEALHDTLGRGIAGGRPRLARAGGLGGRPRPSWPPSPSAGSEPAPAGGRLSRRRPSRWIQPSSWAWVERRRCTWPDHRPRLVDEERAGARRQAVEAGGHLQVGVLAHRVGDAGLLDERDGVRPACRRRRRPTNWSTDPLACSAWAVAASSGVSFWHGTHHEAKKLRTTGWWRSTPSASRSTGAPPTHRGQDEVGGRRPDRHHPAGPDPAFERGAEADEQDHGQDGGQDHADQEGPEPAGRRGCGPAWQRRRRGRPRRDVRRRGPAARSMRGRRRRPP